MIEVGVKNQTGFNIEEKFFQKIAKAALASEGLIKNIELSVALVGRKKIAILNKKYRKKNKPTDVLSFGNDKSKKGSDLFVEAPDGMLKLGEIVICPKIASIKAKSFGFSLKKEFAMLLVHGILHLLGYDHEAKLKEDARKMFQKQNKILQILNIK